MKEQILRVMVLGAFLWLAAVGSAAAQQSSPSVPKFKNDAEKAAWIQANPAEYQRLSGTKGTTTPEFKTAAEKQAWVDAQNSRAKAAKQAEVSAVPNEPTFPVMKNSGNPAADAAEYDANKKAWYEAQEAALLQRKQASMAAEKSTSSTTK